MSTVDNIIPSVRALSAYTLKATEARVKLNQNESPFDLPLEFKERVLRRVAEKNWNRYPDFHPADVLDAIGHHHGLTGEHVLVGNGSNELIQALFAATVRKGVKVAIPSPTFSLYRMMIEANEGTVIDVRLRQDFTYDRDAWRVLAKKGKAHLLLCTPNNPTGSSVSAEFVAELAGMTDKLIVVDEAYQHFGEYDISSLVSEYENIVVLRTFSKALGLAGVRFGYALAAPDLVPEIGKVKLPYNVNIFTLEVARLALEDPAALQSAAAPILEERARLEEACEELPFDAVILGMANFVVVKHENARAIFDFLFERGILVRDIGKYPMLDNCLRFSIGTTKETDELIAALNDFFSE